MLLQKDLHLCRIDAKPHCASSSSMSTVAEIKAATPS
jgi:hypothetical protein